MMDLSSASVSQKRAWKALTPQFHSHYHFSMEGFKMGPNLMVASEDLPCLNSTLTTILFASTLASKK